MSSMETIYLKDYTQPNYWVEKIHLDVDLHKDHAIVTTTTNFFKNESRKGSDDLFLNGTSMELLELSIDGDKDAKFDKTEEGITITSTSDKFELITKVKINPYTNTSCEGLYKSGDILCTQNESQGFRRITYYLDRPDVMASFTTKITGDKKQYPFLLCNGDNVESGNLPDGRHFATWNDPHKKPCYLYALVAGDLAKIQDSFTTMSGKKVSLEIFVDPGNEDKVPHAMESLKKSMKWDEDTFGLEYDLNTYMIVAVDSFNMGAMENKGLNIFNSAYTLAKKETATDKDYYNIEAVIGHEYFHNWTGNRVTCRDWFQLTLKEGLTVFRDQEFSSDMNSRGVKRIDDVSALRGHQFPEDAGPLKHAIRPSEYIEINNFYTATVYEKGAEVIRMIHTLIGDSNFKKGMKLYFERFDGMAVTTEDFVNVMSDASGVNLDQFSRWYSTPGTPVVEFSKDFSADKLTLNFKQSVLGMDSELLIPLNIKIFSDSGVIERRVDLDKSLNSYTFEAPENSLVSLNRGFSAPVVIKRDDLSTQDIKALIIKEDDEFSKYDLSGQYFYLLVETALKENSKTIVNSDVVTLIKEMLNSSDDPLLKTYLMNIPSLTELCERFGYSHLDSLHTIHSNFYKELGASLQDDLITFYNKSEDAPKYSEKDMGIRAAKNMALHFLMSSKTQAALDIAIAQAKNAKVMTNEISAISQLSHSSDPEAIKVVNAFAAKWKDEVLVLQKWFSVMSSTESENQVEIMKKLESHSLFDSQIPNFVRSTIGTFGMRNLKCFHKEDGSGYKFLADRLIEVDKQNPQLCARIAKSFTVINKLDDKRAALMKAELDRMLTHNLSKDTFEVIQVCAASV